eukprot:m.250686 g.250686  ORF g.250686 m.250686 type:complete len:308 (+) comp40324_c2_seq13:128-1051(+)
MTAVAFEMNTEIDYESLPTDRVGVHMLAGAAAGIMEHCVMYPVDLVKTRMQSLRPSTAAQYNGGILDAFRVMVKSEGMKTPFRGINIVAAGAGPAHALYFATYEASKKALSTRKTGHHPLAHGTAGALATLVHDGFMNPVEVVKQRMQVYGSPYKTSLQCARHIYRSEGIRAFYRSYTTQLSMNIPFQCTNFIVYEATRFCLNPDGQYNPKAHVLAGGAAGAVASAATNPLDVAKTLLNTQEPSVRPSGSHVQGMTTAFKVIYQQNGMSGFFKGIRARIVHQMPATAICWSVYEFFKHLLNEGVVTL